MTTYFGFGLADNMFPASCTITRRELTPAEAKEVIEGEGIALCLNPSHKLTIDAMVSRFGIVVEIPAKAASINLKTGDNLLVMGVVGLPRLEGRHEYTQAEIDGAKFRFGLWTVSEG